MSIYTHIENAVNYNKEKGFSTNRAHIDWADHIKQYKNKKDITAKVMAWCETKGYKLVIGSSPKYATVYYQ